MTGRPAAGGSRGLLGTRDTRVLRIRRLVRSAPARREAGAFVIEGATVIGVALDAGADLEGLFAAPAAERADEGLLARAEEQGIPVHRLAEGVLERVAGTVTPQPVLAVARRSPLPLAALAGANLLVVGIDVRDPGNAGTLVRSAEAAGASGVVFCQGSVDVTNPKTVRASAGALFHVPVVEGGDPQEVLGVLKDFGLMRLGAAPRGGEPPARVDLSGPVALVFGNESRGLSEPAVASLDGLVTIPMAGRSESLNLGMAASILLYETCRQRGPE